MKALQQAKGIAEMGGVHPALGHRENTDGQKEECNMSVAKRNYLTAAWQGDACTLQEGNIWLEHNVETPGLPVTQSPW